MKNMINNRNDSREIRVVNGLSQCTFCHFFSLSQSQTKRWKKTNFIFIPISECHDLIQIERAFDRFVRKN